MSSYMANPQNINRSWFIIDAAGKPLGRVAAQAASIPVSYTHLAQASDNPVPAGAAARIA